MKPALLLLMLAGATEALFQAAETKCNATSDTSQCSAMRGGSVSIQLMTDTSGLLLLCKKQLSSSTMSVFTLTNGKVMIHEPYKNRTEFFINNGTLKITNLEENDSSQYNIDVYSAKGVHLRHIEVILHVNINIWLIVIPVICCTVFFVLVIFSCACWRARRNKKAGSSKKARTTTSSLSFDFDEHNHCQQTLTEEPVSNLTFY